MQIYLILLILFILFYTFVLYLAYEDTRRDFGTLVAKRGLKVQSISMIVLWSTVALGYLVFPPNLRDVIFSMLLIISAIGIWIRITLNIQRNRKAQTLLHLGRIDSPLYVISGIMAFYLGYMQLLDFFSGQGSPILQIALCIVGISFGCLSIATGVSSTSITDSGIKRFSNFIRWQEIDNYHWEIEKEGILTILMKNRKILFRRQVSLQIKSNNIEEVDSLFKRYLKNGS